MALITTRNHAEEFVFWLEGDQVGLKRSDLLQDVKNVGTGSQALPHVHTAVCATGLVHQHYQDISQQAPDWKHPGLLRQSASPHPPSDCWHWTESFANPCATMMEMRRVLLVG